jgi:hypothetical protein
MPSQVPLPMPMPSWQPSGMQPGVGMPVNMPGMRMSPGATQPVVQQGMGMSGPQPGALNKQQKKQTSGGALNKLRSFLGLTAKSAQQQNSGAQTSTSVPGMSSMEPGLVHPSGFDIGNLQQMQVPSIPTMPYIGGKDPSSLGNIYTYVHVHRHEHTETYIHIHTNIYMRVYIHTYIHIGGQDPLSLGNVNTYIYVSVQRYIYIYIYIYMHTQKKRIHLP